MSMNYDKINGSVGYIDSTHTYEDMSTKTKYTSVTTLIGKYEQPYDREYWLGYKALERMLGESKFKSSVKSTILKDKNLLKPADNFITTLGLNLVEFEAVKAEINEEWVKTNKESCDRGTKIHNQIEQSWYDAGDAISLKKFNLGGKFKAYKEPKNLLTYSGVYPEYLIYDKDFKVAGQIDVLVRDEDTIHIIDMKTNKKLDMKSFFNKDSKKHVMMLYPLHTVMDCNFYHYALQLSTYMYLILKNNPTLKAGTLKIHYFPHEGDDQIIDVPYLENEVKAMLKHHSVSDKRTKEFTRIRYD